MPRPLRYLSSQQARHFIDHHFIIIEDAFPREVADRWVADAFARGGVDPQRPETYPGRFSFFGQRSGIRRTVDVREFAPKVFDACADLVGGEEFIDEPYIWSDGFIVNFPSPAGTPWNPPDATKGDWHIDGDYNHFLDSPEIGLFILVIWKDIAPRGGGTAVAVDSVGPVARRMLEHPRGLSAVGFKDNLNQQCRDFRFAEGKAGTVYIMHPFMLHSVAPNLSNTPRVINNPHVRLVEPMNLNRSNPQDYSLVEYTTLRALGVYHLDYHVPSDLRHPTDHDTGERRPVPPRASKDERYERIRAAGTY